MVFGSNGSVLQTVAARVALFTMLAASQVFAQEAAPDVMLKMATVDVVAIIKQDRSVPTSESATVAERVDVRIRSLFDFTHMTQIAVGRNWRAATAAQRQVLVAEFRIMLVRNYTASLSSYRDRAIEFKPLRAAAADTEITVRTFVRQAGAEPWTMDYDMDKRTTEWKVYDVRVGGRSLASAYREAFAGKVRDGGLDGLITSLTETNRRGDTRIRLREKEALYFPIFVWGIMQGVR